MMYSCNDFECLFVRYKAEPVPAGVSIKSFCQSNKVPYNLFERWYKDARKKIIPVQVSDITSAEEVLMDGVAEKYPAAPVVSCTKLHIFVDIRMSNGIHIRQKNLNYEGLKNFVEKLEVLC